MSPNKKIAIDAGHGPNTAGKRSPDGSLREFNFNNPTAQKVREMLLQYENIEVMFTHDPTGKIDVGLDERWKRANDWNADIFISIHANSNASGKWGPESGIETFIDNCKPHEAMVLAAEVQNQLIRETGRRNRGVKYSNLRVLDKTDMTAILVESGFMTNKEECAMLKTESYQNKIATAIVAGIVKVYGLKKKKVVVSSPPVKAEPQPQQVSEWAKEAQTWVKENNISDGMRPKDPVTREEVWRMLYNLNKQK